MPADTTTGSTRSEFRRPTRDDAVALARARFVAGERVEMQVLAADLDIGRTTLYRWVGEREQLLEEVFAGLVDEWFAEVIPRAQGSGRGRLIDVMRRFLEFASGFDPLSEFAAREPALTMRLLLDREGMIAERSKSAVRDLLATEAPDLVVPENIVDAIEVSAAALVWANIAIGREPDIDGSIDLCETLLDAC
jgi:AcrR family transcriptional regulator